MDSSLQTYLKESAHHGTPEFAAAFYHCIVPDDFHDMPAHWHEEMELTMIRSGSLNYGIGSFTAPVSEGDLLLIAPNILHSAHIIEGQSAVTDSVVFHLGLSGSDANDFAATKYLVPLQEGKLSVPPVVHPGEAYYEELKSVFLHMWECRNVEMPYRELEMKIFSLQAVLLTWKLSAARVSSAAPQVSSMHEDKLKLALSYMQEHYAENITISKLANLCGFSEVHFMNIFKQAIGSTCIEYLIEYRLNLAAIDLRETRNSIMQVAMSNGFQNISYFNRTFKKKYRMTPTEYRRSTEEGHSK